MAAGDAVRRLGKRLAPRADGNPSAQPAGAVKLRQAVVSAVSATTADVLLPGDDTVTTAGWIGPQPKVNDTVWVAIVGTAPLVLGVQGAAAEIDQPIVRVTRTTALACADSTWTPVAWDREDTDTTGMHAAGSSGLTILTDGRYQLSGGVGWGAPGAAAVVGRRGCRWVKNGTSLDNGGILLASSPQQNGVYIPARTISVNLVAGDVITLEAFQNNAAALSVSTITASTEGLPNAELRRVGP